MSVGVLAVDRNTVHRAERAEVVRSAVEQRGDAVDTAVRSVVVHLDTDHRVGNADGERSIDHHSGGDVEVLDTLGEDVADLVETTIRGIRLTEQRTNLRHGVRHLWSQTQVIHAPGILDDAVLAVGAVVVLAAPCDDVAVHANREHRSVEERLHVLQEDIPGGLSEQVVDTDRTCTTFRNVDGEERAGEAFADEAMELFHGCDVPGLTGFLIGEQVAEVRLIIHSEIRIRTAPERLDDRSIRADRIDERKQVAVRKFADHISDDEDRHILAGTGIFRREDAGVAGDRHERLLLDFRLTEASNVAGLLVDADQDAVVVASRDRVRAVLGDPVVDDFLTGDHRVAFASERADRQLTVALAALDRVADECSHVVGFDIVTRSDDDTLDELQVFADTLRHVREVDRLTGCRSAVHRGISLGCHERDTELRDGVDVDTTFDPRSGDRERLDRRAEVGQFGVDRLEVVFAFLTESAGRCHGVEQLAESDRLVAGVRSGVVERCRSIHVDVVGCGGAGSSRGLLCHNKSSYGFVWVVMCYAYHTRPTRVRFLILLYIGESLFNKIILSLEAWYAFEEHEKGDRTRQLLLP